MKQPIKRNKPLNSPNRYMTPGQKVQSPRRLDVASFKAQAAQTTELMRQALERVALEKLAKKRLSDPKVAQSFLDSLNKNARQHSQAPKPKAK
jgi:DNA-binding TFAR19-related protein (PDSD5 family)